MHTQFVYKPKRMDVGGYLVKMFTESQQKVVLKDLRMKPIKISNVSDGVSVIYFKLGKNNAREIADLENSIIDAIIENAETWFGGKVKASLVLEAFQHSIIYDKTQGCVLKTKCTGVDRFKLNENRIQSWDLRIVGIRFQKKMYSLLWEVINVSEDLHHACIWEDCSSDDEALDNDRDLVEPYADDVEDMINHASRGVQDYENILAADKIKFEAMELDIAQREKSLAHMKAKLNAIHADRSNLSALEEIITFVTQE